MYRSGPNFKFVGKHVPKWYVPKWSCTDLALTLVLNLRQHDHVTPALQQLHWLPIEYRITYKLCLTMHLVHTNRTPQYLSGCVHTVLRSNGRPVLRSSDTAAYVKPRCRTRLRECGFSYAGPTVWNSLPDHLHQISDTKLNYFAEHTVATNSTPQYLSGCVHTVSRSNGRPVLRSSDTAAYVKVVLFFDVKYLENIAR